MAEPIQPYAVERKAFYTKPGKTMPFSFMHSSQCDGKVRPECILVEKVINECFIAECPIPVRFPDLPSPVGNIEDCQVQKVEIVNVAIPEEDVVELTFRFCVLVEFDGQEREGQFEFTKRVLLEGADPDAFDSGVLFVVPFSFAQCVGCRIVLRDNNTIECELGLFVLLKLTTFVQLEVQAKFCPMPPECAQISPIGCPEFLERATRGDFLPPRPVQFFP